MKKSLLFIATCFCTSWLSAQYIHKIKADSVLITNDSCNAELILENSTKHTLGFLYNKGNGRTEFRSISGSFILNQNLSAQSARMWVTGQIRTDSMIRVGQLTADPSGADGMIYYNSTYNRFRNYRMGGWEDFLTSGNIGNGLVYYNNKLEIGGVAESINGVPNGHLTRDAYIHTYDLSSSASRKFSIQTAVGPGGTGLAATFNQDGLVLGGQGNGFYFNSYDPTRTILKVGDFASDGTKQTNGFNNNGTGVEIYLKEQGTNGNTYGQRINVEANNNVQLYGLTIRTVNEYNTYPANSLKYTTALKLTARTPNIIHTPYTWETYALYADSGRVYSRDSVMFGTTTPGAFFHVNGTSRFDLGSDATGDMFYRDSLGYFRRLGIGTSGQVLTVSGGLPFWANTSGGGGSPGGSNGQVQFNNAGSFGGSSNFIWDNTNNRLGISTATPQYDLDVNGGARINTLPFVADRDTLLTYDPSTKQLKSTQRKIQEDGTDLATQRGTINFNYGVKATENSGAGRSDINVELSNAESFMTSDVTLSANAYSDAVSLSLAAGTWLITGSVTIESTNNNAMRVTYKLWDGSTVYQAGEGACPGMGSGTKGYVCVPFSYLAVLGSTTTVKVSIASTLASSVIKATPGDNNSGTTNKATSIRAVRIK